MQKRILGKTGYAVSEIGLGCWQLGGDFGPVDDQTAEAILDQATQLDVDFWDTADVYGAGQSESRIGAQASKPLGLKIATKVGRSGALYPDHYSRDGVRASLKASADRLGVQTLDLAQLHCVPRPVLEEGAIFGWLDELVEEGLIRFYGASVETVDEGLLCLKHENLATLQIIFNIFRQDAAEKLLPLAQQQNVGIIVRLPLASGLLSGKFGKHQQFPPQDHRNYNRDGAAFSVGETFGGIPFETGVKLVEELAGLNPDGRPLSHLAIRWILDHPAVSTVIAGVSKPQQLADNVAGAGSAPLKGAELAQLADFYRTRVRQHIRGAI
jgi:aryl-alcohol dehydrogenase-like predicted oxidoreductase